MKIKTKKKMNLPQLIEWAWDKNIKERYFYSNKGSEVFFGINPCIEMECLVYKNELFEVEWEEEVTEKTKIPRLIEVCEYEERIKVFLYENESIKSVLDYYFDDLFHEPKAFYMLNDDMSMTLLWKDGGMVE
ncbi:hypothetical protein [Staphylococcus ratti]|uniref:Phage protein n=1 Tax=Staphylococcus ratti TaxID=2892440 RepID=A0ABY3PBL2_9STAP|nr:hypothetical protein [Staphylococcus ratti]UEX89706.1 hypothetical protein LN051_09065 [Staphylococcus ratti]